ncbi:hypothetical protein M8J77_000368 [Diaphorina citri]|nr:hypothetical protein M8J77_000368 [Diaphorina citri]
MAPIKFARVVSYSSEDPVHKADNLLNPESTKKWKCKSMGEKQAVAILQLSSQVQINGIDIGNEFSAFVEVFVAKSSNPDDYKVLLPAVFMMSIQDSKQGVGVNSVRFFKSESLLHADETWDRIKVVCSQPYNKCVQYGLAFVTVHSATVDKKDDVASPSTSSQSTPSQKLGNFILKDDSSDSSPISLGNWFSKRKAISPPKEYTKVPRTSLASSIKEDSSPQLVKVDKPKKKEPKKKNDDFSGRIEVKVPENNGSARRANHGPLLYVPDEDDSNDSKDGKTNGNKHTGKTKDVKPSTSEKKDGKGEKKKDSQGSDKKKDSSKKEADSQRSNDTKAKQDFSKKPQNHQTPSTSVSGTSRKQTKPFSRLLEGVTFVISGFENPLRSDLRNQALEMGAYYKANWDGSCTHLVCAFPNTPKCRSVQSLNGKIVTKDWIGDCYNQCKRLPWRRYALIKADRDQSESEEEIDEERVKPKISPSTSRLLLGSAVSNHDVSSSTTSNSQATSGISSSHTQSTSSQDSQPSVLFPPQAASSSQSPSTSSTLLQSPRSQSVDPYDGDTDIDESPEFSGKLPAGGFSNMFKDLSFLVHSSLGESMQNKLFRYITTYGGYCSCEGQSKYTPIPKPSQDEHFDYVLADTLDRDEKIKYVKSRCIKSAWIWECVNQNKLVDCSNYTIKTEEN